MPARKYGLARRDTNFQLYKDTWRVAFLEADCKTSLPLKASL